MPFELEKVLSIKESIIEAGISLLESQGIAAITQPRVAGAAGIKQSHLTYYFPTRTDLLVAIAERWITRALDDFGTRLNDIPTMPALAEAMAETMNDGPHPRAIVGLIVAADAEPKIRDSLRALDPVAYVRFASVYRNFREAKDFEEFISDLAETNFKD